MTEDTSQTIAPGRRRWMRVLAVGTPAVILVLVYLYVWLRIDPKLLYHRESPAFVTTFRFFRSFLDRPGGILAYVSAFLMQSCRYPWLGAALITTLAGLVCLATRGLLGVMTDRRVHPSVYFIPAVLLLMAHGQYKHLPVTSMAVLTALALANLHVRIGLRRFAARLTVFLILAAGLHYAVGGMVVLFAVLVGVFELLKERRIVLGVLCLLCGTALPFAVAAYSYGIDTTEALVFLPPYRGGMVLLLSGTLSVQVAIHVLLLLFFPVAMVMSRFRVSVSGLVSRFRPRGSTAAQVPTPEPSGSWTPVSLGIFLVVGALLTFLSVNGGARTRLQIDYDADHGNWEAVLENARRLSCMWYDVFVVHEVNRALHHAGRMSQELFSYPQKDIRGALTTDHGGLLANRKLAQFFLDLGRVNAAQHWGHIALETGGESPALLKLLFKVSVLKRRTELARTYLHALAKHLLWRRWAEAALRRLDEDPLMSRDSEIVHLRSIMVTQDFRYGGFGGLTYSQIVSQPLRTNPRNRMAFEYLMTHLLLAKYPHKVAANIRRLDDFDYVGIPRPYEEAILVYRKTNPGANPDLGGRRVSPETVERFRGFMRDVLVHQRLFGSARETAYSTLAERWGDTYFFYFTFGFSEPRRGWRIIRPMTPAGAEE